MVNLDYKGFRSTRIFLTMLCMFMTTLAFYKSAISPTEWLDFLKWIVGIYISSEVGAKGATAYKERKNDS